MKYYSGMYAAIPTPFHADGTIHEESFRLICERIIETGMQGILVCGSTGEYPLLTNTERKQAVKAVCEAVAGRTQVIAGCSCHNQAETIDMVKYAESVGADMALVVPPYYMQTTEEGISQYYKAVSDSCDRINLLLYNYPEATAVRLSVELITKLSTLPHVVGIKNTDEMAHTSKLVGSAGANPNFGIVNGYEHLVMGTLASGGDGTMGIIHALAPVQMMELYNAFLANDLKKAMEINDLMRPLYTLMEKEPCPAPIKAAMEMLGIECGVPRRPMLPASEGIKVELRAELERIGLQLVKEA